MGKPLLPPAPWPSMGYSLMPHACWESWPENDAALRRNWLNFVFFWCLYVNSDLRQVTYKSAPAHVAAKNIKKMQFFITSLERA